MIRNICTILSISCIICIKTTGQGNNDIVSVKDALKVNREKVYHNIVSNSITKNLSLPLTDNTEENWQDAFYALELINYRSPWVEERVRLAFESVDKRSIDFQRALLELAYANYKGKFTKTVNILMQKTPDPKIFAMAAEYYLSSNQTPGAWNEVVKVFTKRPDMDKGIPAYYGLLTKLISGYSEKKDLTGFFNDLKNAIPGQILLLSFQRKNRDYPGIVLVRSASGNLITDETGNIFAVPQLARSINNLPFYLTNGNTPQGIFRMKGFDVSKSMAIGPTANIQLIMPYEVGPQYFLNDPAVTDNEWTEDLYKRLLPESLKEYSPLFESYFAGKMGRTEIIAHGTTVNPEYYKNQPFYPLTPTEGCLSTKEIWSTVDGRRLISDQQKLVDALKKAGGADGYCIVIEIDDEQRPVILDDILKYLK